MSDFAQCEDCFHHFTVDPRGDIQSAACPDCGGTRLLRGQPSGTPAIPDEGAGTLQNMVDSETQKDQGGNPLGEGTIMGKDGEVPLDTGSRGRDNYMHGSVLAAFVSANEEPCPHCGWSMTPDPHGMGHYCENCQYTDVDPVHQIQEPGVIKTLMQNHDPGWDYPEIDMHDQEHFLMPLDFRYREEPGDYQRDKLVPPPAQGFGEPKFGAHGDEQGYNGWTNWDTWHTALIMDNDYEMYQQQQRMAEEGWTPEQIRDWAVRHVIGPHNKQQIEDAQEWNSKPMEERNDPHYDEFMKDHGDNPKAMDLYHGLIGGPDIEDYTPQHLMDPELVNWHEIHHNLMSDYENNRRHENGEPPTWQTEQPPADDKPGETTFPPEWTAKFASGGFLRWTPGRHGRGLVIGGEPHTWDVYDPNEPGDPSGWGPAHENYVKELGVKPDLADWNTGVEILPNGELDYGGERDPAPYIAADPRLKPRERVWPRFTLNPDEMKFQTHSRPMEPYDSWEHVADVMFQKGPIQNVPQHSEVVQPGPAGLHGTPLDYLDFLDAHVNGTPVRSHAGMLRAKHGALGPEAGQPIVVSVHDPAHLPAAVAQIQWPGAGPSPQMSQLAHQIKLGEVAPPPGVNPDDIEVEQGHTAAFLPAAIPALGDVAEMVGGANMIKEIPVVGGLMNKALGVGAAPQQQAQPTYQSPLAPEASVLDAFFADYETPASNPDVGTKHDDPEDVDQKEFNDQDRSPENLKNPNLEDSGASGEDEVRAQEGFGPDSQGIGRLEMLMPLVMHYYHSDESGAHDPMIKGLHEMLEKEIPDYLSKADDHMADEFVKSLKHPHDVHAAVKQSIVPPIPGITDQTAPQGTNPMQQAVMPQPSAPPAQGMPSAISPPGGQMQQGHCPGCGGVTTPNGVCPQCGMKGANPEAGGQSPIMQMPGQAMPQNRAANESPLPVWMTEDPHCGHNNQYIDGEGNLKCEDCGSTAFGPQAQPSRDPRQREGANHQGPVTPEQISAVQQWLLQNGRPEEVPNVPLDPGNPIYADILAEIQQNQEVQAPPVAPEEATPPPPPPGMPPGGAPGGMPVPGMGGEPGGQPMQPMAHTAADNIAKRCKKCKSASTGMVGDKDHHARCHSCGHVWREKILSDMDLGTSTVSAVLAMGEHPHHDLEANPLGVPASEQQQPLNQGGDEDSSLTWQDSEGQPIQANKEYMMHEEGYGVPDMVRVLRVKPDGLQVEFLGTYEDTNALSAPGHITREEMEMRHYKFEPLPQNVDERNNQPPPGSMTPGEEHIPPSGTTTDEEASTYPQYNSSHCPRCGHDEHTASMLSPIETEHLCYRCGHIWMSKESAEGVEANLATREWLKEDNDDDGFNERMAEMMKARAQSRDLKSIAAKDTVAQQIKERLDSNQRIAGKNFSPAEQRTLIDEEGMARNADLLDLRGTHYREDLSGKANGANVPDEHLLFGLI